MKNQNSVSTAQSDDVIRIASSEDRREKTASDLELERELSQKRTRGFIVDCDGENAIVTAMADSNVGDKENYWSVGQLISIQVGKNRIVGLTYKVVAPSAAWDHASLNKLEIHLELVGEIIAATEPGGRDVFSRGIANYPQMGCIAHRIRSSDLETIYESSGDAVIGIGNLTQDTSIEAKIDLNKLLSRHFAIVGTTGVGKSTSVTLILRKIVEKRPDIRVLILDPHNEFATAFPDHSVVIDNDNLVLPFWLFTLDEFTEVVFRGQKGLDTEMELLRDLIPLAKERFRSENDGKSTALKKRVSKTNLTADMPIPYRMPDLLKLVDERLGLLESKSDRPVLKSLMHRLEALTADARFRFMFELGQGGDILEDVVSNIFRIPQNGKPICVLEMSGLPTEVMNSVVSVLCRMAFDLALNSHGGVQTLVVCEEAHRYIPADPNGGFWPTRQAIARIAKEGRKYGVFLGIITQRPGELDPTILSQCNTIFAMRLGNQGDQEIMRGAVTNGAKSTIGFLSSIANRECIAFGEAIQTPMRMTFETIVAKDLPGARMYERQAAIKAGEDVSIGIVLRRMRQENGSKSQSDIDEQLVEPGNPVDQTAEASQSGSVDIEAGDETLPVDQPGDKINAILSGAGALHDDAAPRTNARQDQAGTGIPVGMPEPAAMQDTRPQVTQSQANTAKTAGASDLIRSFRDN